MNIVQLFLTAAAKYPNRMAIIEDKDKITYAGLAKEVRQTAAYFKEKGIKKGDRVLVFVPMSTDLYRVVLSLYYIGATAVFLDEWVSRKRLELCCKFANCKGFVGVFAARVYAFFSKELRTIPTHLTLTGRQNELLEFADVNEDDSALITFTTGSTGTPKAADRTHGFLKAQFDALIHEIEPVYTDIDMPVLPIVLFVNLGVGCTSVIAKFKMSKPDQMKVSKIADQIQLNEVNRITASPFFIRKLAEHAIQNQAQYSSLTKLFTGGAPVFPNEAKIYQNAFQNAQIKIVYGSTEAEPISAILAPQLAERENDLLRGLPVGQPYSEATVKTIRITEENIPTMTDAEFEHFEVAKSEIGEIVVSGPHVLKKYYDNQDAFEQNKIVVDTTIWHRTGDSGFLEDGELFLTGRCKQLINYESGLISPFIIENQLQNIESITMGTIIEIENKIILVLESKNKAREFDQQFNQLPHDTIEVVSKIPRDPRHNSKIDYEKLKMMLTD